VAKAVDISPTIFSAFVWAQADLIIKNQMTHTNPNQKVIRSAKNMQYGAYICSALNLYKFLVK